MSHMDKPLTKLPDAIMRAWGPNTQAHLGGWMQIAGVDPVEAFSVKRIKDHPWLGLTVLFPAIGPGTINRCLTHPGGKLMFDVDFPDPVPKLYEYGEACELNCLHCPGGWHAQTHRYFADEIKGFVEGTIPLRQRLSTPVHADWSHLKLGT